MTSTPGDPSAPSVEHLSATLRPPVVTVVLELGPELVPARVRGQIDTGNVNNVRRDLTMALASSSAGLDIDMSAVTFCDSSGLHVLLDLNPTALETGKSLMVTTPSRPVDRLLRLTGADGALTARSRPTPKAPPPGAGPNPLP
ncbi:STAS domain-containing protein [Streptomyces sp. NPDC059385]|uniref:STAS domain-containing protein n=1 Tax=Streptomyces sp. NPDC059385 TaxID=3346817 RepID=UPI0036CBE2EC